MAHLPVSDRLIVAHRDATILGRGGNRVDALRVAVQRLCKSHLVHVIHSNLPISARAEQRVAGGGVVVAVRLIILSAERQPGDLGPVTPFERRFEPHILSVPNSNQTVFALTKSIKIKESMNRIRD